MNILSRLLALLRCVALLALFLGAASPALAAKTYADNLDGTVTDPSTGLTWMRCSMGQTWSGTTCTGTASTYTWDQAKALTGTVTFAGQGDWRLPNIRELQTIVDLTVYNPAIDTKTFPATPNSDFWSGSPNANNSSYAWYVNFGYGYANNDLWSNLSSGVRLVRGGQSLGLLNIARPSTDYVDQGDGTVMHTPTRLTWQRCAVGQSWTGSACSGSASTFTWGAAKLLTSNLAGKADWRLPTEDELLSLVDYSKSNPSINATPFPNTPSSEFWSGSPHAYYSYNAWYVHFYFGGASYDFWNHSYGVRLVRGGQCFGPLVLSISKTGMGQIANSVGTGTQCSPGASGYYAGDMVTLSASPVANLLAWGGACASAGTAATCTVTMDAAKTVTAQFKDTTTPLALARGWNLLGNGMDQPLEVATRFGDPANVTTVWKWDVASAGWQFYAPSMDAAALQSYAADKNYGVLTSIHPGEGFWVNAAQPFSATQASGAAITGNDFQAGRSYALKPGWNLAAIGNALSPSAFNTGLSAVPPAPGAVPVNLTTLWAWDNPQGKWYFYAPNLEGQGGSVLTDYLTGKGYLDFTASSKLLGPGVGFWVTKT